MDVEQRSKRIVVTGIGVVGEIRGFATNGYLYAHATEIHDLRSSQAEYDRLIESHGRAACLAILAARQASGRSLRYPPGVWGRGTTDGVDQIDDRPHHGRGRLHHRHAERFHSANSEFLRSRPRLRHRLRAKTRTRRAAAGGGKSWFCVRRRHRRADAAANSGASMRSIASERTRDA